MSAEPFVSKKNTDRSREERNLRKGKSPFRLELREGKRQRTEKLKMTRRKEEDANDA